MKDMHDHFSEYDTFIMMKVAYERNNHELFEKCITELEDQSFEQMKYYQLSLLGVELPLFKLVIKSHNTYKSKAHKGLTYKSINDLIKLYCDANSMTEHEILEIKL